MERLDAELMLRAPTDDREVPLMIPYEAPVRRWDITTPDGDVVDFSRDDWEQGAHQSWEHADAPDGPWLRCAVGTMHNRDEGIWLVYRWRADHEYTAVVSGDINAAAAFLTRAERGRLGLPEPEPEPLVVQSVSREDLAATMADVRRRLVADDAEPDAGLIFAQEVARQRLEAVARGAATDHKWSTHNRALVYGQAAKRGAQIVGWMGGARQWEAADREVVDGAVGYEIWAPVTRRSNADDEDDETGNSRVTGFRSVRVYDYTETRRRDGAPDPDWSPRIPGGDPALLARMRAISPLPVVDDTTGSRTGSAHGWTDGRKIVLSTRHSIAQQASTLAHELGHAQLDHVGRIERGEITREHAEQEAGLVAHLVVANLGFDDDQKAASEEGVSAYLRHWVKSDGKPVAGHKQRWKILQERIGPATDAAHHILTTLLGAGEPETSKAAA